MNRWYWITGVSHINFSMIFGLCNPKNLYKDILEPMSEHDMVDIFRKMAFLAAILKMAILLT